jgi:hypothetical protein
MRRRRCECVIDRRGRSARAPSERFTSRREPDARVVTPDPDAAPRAVRRWRTSLGRGDAARHRGHRSVYRRAVSCARRLGVAPAGGPPRRVRDHARGDILRTASLDPPRRPLPGRTGVEQQRDHHRRIVRCATPPRRRGRTRRTPSNPSPQRRRSQPRQVPLRRPHRQARRQQQRLLTITPVEVLRHAGIVIASADRPPVCATASATSDSGRARRWGPT